MSGGVDGLVSALAVYRTSLFVGGNFLNAGAAPAMRIARWDGASTSVSPAAAPAAAARAGRVVWDGRDGGGHLLPAGIYFVELHAPAATLRGRVLLRR